MSTSILNLLKKVFKGALNGIDKTTMLQTAHHFMEGVYKGFGGNFDTIAYNTPDYDKLRHLERNVYQFSGAKNYHQMRALTDALREGDKVLSYREFRPKAQAIVDEYQGRWLQTEYNTAVAGSQAASKWVEYEKHPEALLEYRTQEDERVRDDHRPLNGVILPVSHPFWTAYAPPNGWGCRCTTIRLNRGIPTPDHEIKYPEVPELFQTNLGQAGLIFPRDSPYFIGIPDDIKKQINSLIPNRDK